MYNITIYIISRKVYLDSDKFRFTIIKDCALDWTRINLISLHFFSVSSFDFLLHRIRSFIYSFKVVNGRSVFSRLIYLYFRSRQWRFVCFFRSIRCTWCKTAHIFFNGDKRTDRTVGAFVKLKPQFVADLTIQQFDRPHSSLYQRIQRAEKKPEDS